MICNCNNIGSNNSGGGVGNNIELSIFGAHVTVASGRGEGGL